MGLMMRGRETQDRDASTSATVKFLLAWTGHVLPGQNFTIIS